METSEGLLNLHELEVKRSRHTKFTEKGKGVNSGCHRVDPQRVLFDLAYRFVTSLPEPLPCKQLVKDGIWQVPASERPKGWERMGVKENV